jgi:hypothetical protein
MTLASRMVDVSVGFVQVRMVVDSALESANAPANARNEGGYPGTAEGRLDR